MWPCVCGMGAAVGTVCPRLLEAAFERQVGPDPEGEGGYQEMIPIESGTEHTGNQS